MGVQSNSISKVGTISILSVFLLVQMCNIANPLIAEIGKMYPDVPAATITYVSTCVSMAGVPGAIFASWAAGKWMSYKSASIVAALLMLFGGSAAFFIQDNFMLLLGTRVLVGLGTGMAMTLSSALIARFFSGRKAATMQGVGVAVVNGCGVAYTYFSGLVCVVDVQAAWLLHVAAVVPIVLVGLFLPKIDKEARTPESQKSKTTAEGMADGRAERRASVDRRKRLPLPVFLNCVGFAFVMVFFYPVMTSMSSIVEYTGMGTAALSGAILATYSAGGVIGGLAYGFIDRVLGRRLTVPVLVGVMAVSLAVMANTTNPVVMAIAMLFGSSGKFAAWSAVVNDSTSIVPTESVALASSIFTIGVSFGSFMSTSWIGLVSGLSGSPDPRTTILVSAVGMGVLFAVWLGGNVVRFSGKKRATAVDESR